jgi:hypothetical protein
MIFELLQGLRNQIIIIYMGDGFYGSANEMKDTFYKYIDLKTKGKIDYIANFFIISTKDHFK